MYRSHSKNTPKLIVLNIYAHVLIWSGIQMDRQSYSQYSQTQCSMLLHTRQSPIILVLIFNKYSYVLNMMYSSDH